MTRDEAAQLAYEAIYRVRYPRAGSVRVDAAPAGDSIRRQAYAVADRILEAKRAEETELARLRAWYDEYVGKLVQFRLKLGAETIPALLERARPGAQQVSDEFHDSALLELIEAVEAILGPGELEPVTGA